MYFTRVINSELFSMILLLQKLEMTLIYDTKMKNYSLTNLAIFFIYKIFLCTTSFFFMV